MTLFNDKYTTNTWRTHPQKLVIKGGEPNA